MTVLFVILAVGVIVAVAFVAYQCGRIDGIEAERARIARSWSRFRDRTLDGRP